MEFMSSDYGLYYTMLVDEHNGLHIADTVGYQGLLTNTNNAYIPSMLSLTSS